MKQQGKHVMVRDNYRKGGTVIHGGKEKMMYSLYICETKYPYGINQANTGETIEKKILEFIRRKPYSLTIEIAEALGVSYMTAKRRITGLKDKGIIAKENERWVIMEEGEIHTDSTLRDPFEVSVVFTLEKNPEITIENLASELYLSPTTVRRTIKTLQNRGIVSRIGSARKGRWIVHEYNLKN